MEKPKRAKNLAHRTPQEALNTEDSHIQLYRDIHDSNHVSLTSTCVIDWPPESMITCVAIITPAAKDVVYVSTGLHPNDCVEPSFALF